MNIKKFQCAFSLEHKTNGTDAEFHGKVICSNRKQDILPMLQRIYPEYNVKITVLEKAV